MGQKSKDKEIGYAFCYKNRIQKTKKGLTVKNLLLLDDLE